MRAQAEPPCWPDWSGAWVPAGKLDYYLGRVDHPKSTARAGVFVAILGFRDRAVLRTALLAHLHDHPVQLHKVLPHGLAYNAIGPMVGPSGRTIERMITGWFVAPDALAPRNISAFPDSKRTR